MRTWIWFGLMLIGFGIMLSVHYAETGAINAPFLHIGQEPSPLGWFVGIGGLVLTVFAGLKSKIFRRP